MGRYKKKRISLVISEGVGTSIYFKFIKGNVSQIKTKISKSVGPQSCKLFFSSRQSNSCLYLCDSMTGPLSYYSHAGKSWRGLCTRGYITYGLDNSIKSLQEPKH